MARCVVCVGVPANLEDNEFVYKKGDKKGQPGKSLRFRMRHPLTEVAGSLDFEAHREEHIDRLREAHAAGETLRVVVQARCQRYEREGQPADFATLVVRAIDA